MRCNHRKGRDHHRRNVVCIVIPAGSDRWEINVPCSYGVFQIFIVRLLKFGRLKTLSVIERHFSSLIPLAPRLIGKVMHEPMSHIISRLRKQYS